MSSHGVHDERGVGVECTASSCTEENTANASANATPTASPVASPSGSPRAQLSPTRLECEADRNDLRKAARVGLALLERNQELEAEHNAMQLQVAALQLERNELRAQLECSQSDLALMTDARKVAVLECHDMQKRLEHQQQQTQLAEQRALRLEATLTDSREAHGNCQLLLQQVQSEIEQLCLQKTMTSEDKETTTRQLEELRHEMHLLETRLQTVSDQKATLEEERDALKQEKAVWSKSRQALDQLQLENTILTKDYEDLHRQLHRMDEELMEQKKLVESVEMMNAMYKEIVDSRSDESYGNGNSSTTSSTTGTGDLKNFRSFQEELAETNEKLVEQVVEFQKRDAMRNRQWATEHDGENDDEETDEWVEETRQYPAPPGDLDSPLIKCLLDHWTHEKTKRLSLADWLHNAIRRSTPSSCLRLEKLSSEVTAGFCQLLLPVLREKHGLQVTMYRRVHHEIISDLILTTDKQPITEFQKHEKSIISSSTSCASFSPYGRGHPDGGGGRGGPHVKTLQQLLSVSRRETHFLFGD